jgi:6-phosphogluconolactonase (cycloisomerase 2 family)
VLQDSYRIGGYAIAGSSGALTSLRDGFPLPLGTDTVATTIVVHPSGDFLYAAQANAGFLVYRVHRDTGVLTPIPGSPFANNAVTPMLAHPSGRFLVARTVTPNEITVWGIDAATGVPTRVGSSPVPGTFHMAFNASGGLLFINNGSQPGLSIFRFDVNTGGLSLITSTFDPGGYPGSFTVSDSFLFVALSDLDSVAAFSINESTGELTPVGTPIQVGDVQDVPRSVTAASSGRFLYIAHAGAPPNGISALAIDRASGALTLIAGSPFPSGSNPQHLAVNASGTFLYAVNQDSNDISAYRIDATTGALTPIAGSPFSTFDEPPVFIILVPPAASPFL